MSPASPCGSAAAVGEKPGGIDGQRQHFRIRGSGIAAADRLDAGPAGTRRSHPGDDGTPGRNRTWRPRSRRAGFHHPRQSGMVNSGRRQSSSPQHPGSGRVAGGFLARKIEKEIGPLQQGGFGARVARGPRAGRSAERCRAMGAWRRGHGEHASRGDSRSWRQRDSFRLQGYKARRAACAGPPDNARWRERTILIEFSFQLDPQLDADTIRSAGSPCPASC